MTDAVPQDGRCRCAKEFTASSSDAGVRVRGDIASTEVRTDADLIIDRMETPISDTDYYRRLVDSFIVSSRK